MKMIEGNILNQTSGIILHQVNNKKVMGAGLALQIRNKYPEHYEDYMEKKHLYLGSLVITCIKTDLIIIGLVAQDGYGRDKDRCYTDYDALEICLKKVSSITSDETVYIPYGIGCGLAGGNWNTVIKIVDEHLPNAILVKYKKGGNTNEKDYII